MHGIRVLLLAASLAFGHNDEYWFLSPARDLNIAKNTAAEIMKAACQGEVNGDSCSKCPESDEGSWTLSALVVGHFSAARSEEAFAGANSCFYSGRRGPAAEQCAFNSGAKGFRPTIVRTGEWAWRIRLQPVAGVCTYSIRIATGCGAVNPDCTEMAA